LVKSSRINYGDTPLIIRMMCDILVIITMPKQPSDNRQLLEEIKRLNHVSVISQLSLISVNENNRPTIMLSLNNYNLS